MHQISLFFCISLEIRFEPILQTHVFQLFTLNCDLHTAKYLNVAVITMLGSDKHQEIIYQANLSPYLYQYHSTHCSSFTVSAILWYLQCYVFARRMLIKQEEI